MMEQVKGVSYSLSEFLGPAYWQNGPEAKPANQTQVQFEKSLLLKEDTDLFHCVIYLAPGSTGDIFLLGKVRNSLDALG